MRNGNVELRRFGEIWPFFLASGCVDYGRGLSSVK